MLDRAYATRSRASQQRPAASWEKQLMPNFWLLLALMIAVSLALRVAAWMHFGTGTIESEGAEYAKIAENLRNGFGFVGLVVPGPQIHFPPLYPLLIAGTSFLTGGDYELAGRLVSLTLGALLPLPVFGIASRLFNTAVGVIAGALTLLHPLTIYLSFMVLSEGAYATLFLSAVYLVVRALDDASNRLWPLIGAGFGICYLVRAEALGAFAISVLFALIANGNFFARGKRVVGAIVVLLIFALPVSIFIYRSTGRLLFEAKSTSITYLDRRILAAETRPGAEFVSAGGLHDVPSPAQIVEGAPPWEVMWAYYAIDSNLKETGQAMRPWADVARDEKINPKDAFPLFLAGVRRAIPQLFRQLSSLWLGAPVLPALALLGAFRRPWRRPQALLRVYFTFVTFAPVAASLFIFWGDNPRYYFIFVPILSIWAANGLFGIGLWTKASMSAAGWNTWVRQPASWILPGVFGLVMITSPIKAVISNWEFSASALPMRVDKDVGSWIGRQQSGSIRIMDLSLPLSFHADAQRHSYFPYTTGELALRYLDAAKIDYIVLRHGEKYTKYYEDWLEKGIPSSRAELVQLPSIPGAEKFAIYKWRRAEP
jgi:4-amino-4-deoxy-L-arabinose transferase-like glycosyltransferase